MLKRKLVRAGFFANGLILLIATVNGADNQQPADSISSSKADLLVQQLQAFDSSFVDLREFPEIVIANVPQIKLNPRMVKYVNEYNRKNSEAFEKIRGKSSRYFQLFDSILSMYRLPMELKYLAVVESQLDSRAVSHCGAAGPWQLMPTTARELSLRVKGKYDERKNYSKSTLAAAKYLRDLHRQFEDWLLVIAAYNSGPGKVLYAIEKAGSRNFWALQNYLPAETRGHVKRFIATHYYFEGHGSITTLTKREAQTYRNAVSEFIAKQKTDLAKDQVKNTDFNNGSNGTPDKELIKTVSSTELKLNEQ